MEVAIRLLVVVNRRGEAIEGRKTRRMNTRMSPMAARRSVR